ncbi:ABC1 kinase family protein [Planococcus salinarum]|uniref:ABC1 kinase family protein n=1 Tax=Planococcus salinarum TaxID=622695 RepID=UPI001E474823|nr:AarF/UbiB family protein [Planococcus salinarum]
MGVLKFVLELLVIVFIIYYISGRLMGPRINFQKRILSVSVGVALTTFLYWYSYLRFTDYTDFDTVQIVQDETAILWIGSMLLISMLLYLFFELFDPVELGELGERKTGRGLRLIRWRTRLREQRRLSRILEISVRNGFSQALDYARHRGENDRELARAFRVTLEESGGIFVKFGQMLSTHSELFPPAFIQELGSLQQNVKPLTSQQVHDLLNEKLPYRIEDVFAEVDMDPLAAGSIGQVHKALLKNGDDVVVKLLRPDIQRIMQDDLNLLVDFVEWLSKKSVWINNIGIRDLAIGFANNMREEVDFNIEIRNTIQLANIIEKSDYDIKIPKVYTEYSNSKLIVLEYLDGKSIAKGKQLFDMLQVDRNEFARTVLFSYLEQMFFHGIFHADPHPGNIFIDKMDGKPIILDFGAVGRLSEEQQEALNHFVIGIQQSDVGVITDAMIALVQDTKSIERKRIEYAISQILLRISYIDKIPTRELIHSMFDIVRDFDLKFYSPVSTALRALIVLDATIHTMDPGFDMFKESKSFAKKYKASYLFKPFTEPSATKEKIEEELALWLPELAKVPKRFDRLVQRIESGKVILHHDVFSDKHNSMFVTQLFSRFVLLMTGITFGLVSSALLAIAQFIDTAYAVYLNIASYTGLFLSVVLLVRLSIQAIRDIKRTSNL